MLNAHDNENVKKGLFRKKRLGRLLRTLFVHFIYTFVVASISQCLTAAIKFSNFSFNEIRLLCFLSLALALSLLSTSAKTLKFSKKHCGRSRPSHKGWGGGGGGGGGPGHPDPAIVGGCRSLKNFFGPSRSP